MIGRIRTVKPEIFSDEKLWDLSQETGLPLLQAFQGLWCYADREGRFEWRPRALKTLILPYWEGDFSRALEALERARYVVRYTVDGQEFGIVRNFAKHQRVNQREAQSTLPPPPVIDLHVHARGEGNRRELEQKGMGTEPAPARAAHPPEVSPPEVPGLDIVHPGPLPQSKRERDGELRAYAMTTLAEACPALMHRYPKDFGPTKDNQARGVELGLTEEELWQRWDECRDKRYPSPFDDPVRQFNRELAWAKADKEKRVFKTKAERDAFEMPGRERRHG